MKRRAADLVGRYGLVVTHEHLVFIEEVLLATVQECDRDRARQQAIEEAERAELEILTDGTLASRAGDEEFLRVRLPPTSDAQGRFRFEKTPGAWVELTVSADGRLIATQPGRPTSVFVRRV